jgi:hypothetical protein
LDQLLGFIAQYISNLRFAAGFESFHGRHQRGGLLDRVLLRRHRFGIEAEIRLDGGANGSFVGPELGRAKTLNQRARSILRKGRQGQRARNGERKHEPQHPDVKHGSVKSLTKGHVRHTYDF